MVQRLRRRQIPLEQYGSDRIGYNFNCKLSRPHLDCGQAFVCFRPEIVLLWIQTDPLPPASQQTETLPEILESGPTDHQAFFAPPALHSLKSVPGKFDHWIVVEKRFGRQFGRLKATSLLRALV